MLNIVIVSMTYVYHDFSETSRTHKHGSGQDDNHDEPDDPDGHGHIYWNAYVCGLVPSIIAISGVLFIWRHTQTSHYCLYIR